MKILYLDLENIQRPEHIFHPGARSKFGGRAAGFCADLAYVLCFGYKWAGDKKASCLIAKKADFKKDPFDDKKLLLAAKEIIDQADIVVTWYGSGHDMPFLLTRMMAHGISIDHKIKHIDLYKIAKKELRLSSNRLNSAAKFFGLEEKIDIDKIHWPKCWQGDYSSLVTMGEYCAQDVEVLEQVANALGQLVPWPSPKKIAKIKDPTACSTCLSTNTQHRGFRVTKVRKVQRFQCQDCGSWFSE